MKLFLANVVDAVKYALSDRKGLLVICGLMAVTSFVTKNAHLNSLFRLLAVTLLIVTGYGSYVSWYSLKGSDKHPKINNLKKLTWEGFKKSLITVIYSIGLTFLFHHAKINLEGNMILAAISAALFVLLYLCMIAGLLNRYLHRGQFSKAFNLLEIIELLSLFDIRSFIRVLAAVIISQAFAIAVIIPFTDGGFSMTELLFSISTFFLAPFLYISAKRFIGLNVRELLEKSNKSQVPPKN